MHRIGIVSDCPLRRHQVQTALTELGFSVVCSREPARIQEEARIPEGPEVWVLILKAEDLWDEVTDLFLEQDAVPVLFDEEEIPQRQTGDYLIWKRRLQVKLEQLCGSSEEASEGSEPAEVAPLQQARVAPLPMPHYLEGMAAGMPAADVVLLAASLGGPAAIKTFVDCLPPNLPVGFLYAQHIDDQAAQVLVRVLGRDGSYPLAEVVEGQPVRTGEITLVPIARQVVFDDRGLARLTQKAWPGAYNPSIDQIMLNAGDHFKSRLRVIFFSGMDNDGSRAAPILKAYGVQLWAQDSESCANSSMPDAAFATGCVSFRGTPADLAEKLLKSLENDALIKRRNNPQDTAL